jgi:hypothetical protein
MKNYRKLMNEKQIREFQLNEVNAMKNQEKKAKKLYEKELVDNLKHQMQLDQEKQNKKRE